MPTLKDITTGETRTIHICYQCDPEQYPRGKPIDVNDWMARKDEKGNWICGDCQIEDLNKRKIRVLGRNHPESKFIIDIEDKNADITGVTAADWNGIEK
jgi:hypothetical protein